MGKPLEIAALNLFASIARGYASHPLNKIDLDNESEIKRLNKISLRALFLILITLHMEEIKVLPSSDAFQDSSGFSIVRDKLISGNKEYGGKKLSIVKRLVSTMEKIFMGQDSITRFPARLFDLGNPRNDDIRNWRFYDSDIVDPLLELFRLWSPSLSLSFEKPSLRDIVDLYPYLIDFTPSVASRDFLILKGGEKVIPLSDATTAELRQGEIVKFGQVFCQRGKSQTKSRGIVYTPDNIVEGIVSRTLAPLVESVSDVPIRVLDPACGTGRFLLGALDFLVNTRVSDEMTSAEKTRIEREIISESIFGIDEDPLAVELAEISLMLRAHGIGNPSPSFANNLIVADTLFGIDSHFVRELSRTGKADIFGRTEGQATFDELPWFEIWENIMKYDKPQIESRKLKRYFDYILNAIRKNVSVDLFTKNIEEQLRKCFDEKNKAIDTPEDIVDYFHPELFFPHIFYDTDGKRKLKAGFHAVIGNPPYGDLASSEEKELLEKLGYQSGGSGNNDIFRFFIERGLSLLIPDGMLGFIIPNSFINGKKYQKFRNRVMELSVLIEIFDFDKHKIFKRDVFTALLFLKRKQSPQEQALFITSIDGTLTNIKVTRYYPDETNETWYPKCDLLSKINNDQRICQIEPFIGKIGDVGINYQRKDVGRTNREPSRIAKAIFYEGEKEHPDDLQYLKGEDIERFVVKPVVARWLRHDWKDRLRDNEIVNVNIAWANCPSKILTRQTGDSIIAAVDNKKYLTGRSLHTTILSNLSYSPYYLIAILNSRLINRIYSEMTHEHGRPQAQVKLANLRCLPIRTIDFDSNYEIRESIVEKEKTRIIDEPNLLPHLISELIICSNESAAHDLIAFVAEHIENMLKSGDELTDTVDMIKATLDNAVDELYNLECHSEMNVLNTENLSLYY